MQDPYRSQQPGTALDPNQPPPLADLPPVEAPSASFVVQLFVIPAVVVAVVIVVWLLFGKLAGGERDAMEYVRQLRLPSANWRSAFELASLIQNDSQLASDPRLLGELTDLLSFELKQNENPRLTQYVALTVGAFQTLDATLADGRKVDPIEPLTQALEPKYETPIRIAAAASLAKQAARLHGTLDDPRAVRRWRRRPPKVSRRFARWRCTLWDSWAVKRPPRSYDSGCKATRTATSATTRPWPWVAGAIWRQREP